MNAAIALFTRSRDAPTMPASSSWVTGSMNSSASPASSSSRLAVRPGDVEEHRVGQRLVRGAQAAGEQRDHAPQQRRAGPRSMRRARRVRDGDARSDGSRARASAERPSPSNSGISPNRSPGSISATTDSRPSTDLLAMAMRPDAHDEQLVRRRRPRRTARRRAAGDDRRAAAATAADRVRRRAPRRGRRGEQHRRRPCGRHVSPPPDAWSSCADRGRFAGTLGSTHRCTALGRAMSFDVGDKVVYPHHGAAVIERREKKRRRSARTASTSCSGSRTAISR